MKMRWQTLQEFEYTGDETWEEIQAYNEQHDLPAGTEVRVVYEGIDWWTCLNFDAFWGEWLQKVPPGFILDDVRCDDGNGYVYATVAGSQGVGFWLAFGAFMLIAAAILGVFAFTICKLQVLLPYIAEITKWFTIAAVGVSAAFVLTALIRRR